MFQLVPLCVAWIYFSCRRRRSSTRSNAHTETRRQTPGFPAAHKHSNMSNTESFMLMCSKNKAKVHELNYLNMHKNRREGFAKCGYSYLFLTLTVKSLHSTTTAAWCFWSSWGFSACSRVSWEHLMREGRVFFHPPFYQLLQGVTSRLLLLLLSRCTFFLP